MFSPDPYLRALDASNGRRGSVWIAGHRADHRDRTDELRITSGASSAGLPQRHLAWNLLVVPHHPAAADRAADGSALRDVYR